MGLATRVPRRQMKARRALPKAVLLTSTAVVAFFIFLLIAGARLLEVDRALENGATEDMSWSVLQAQVESHRFLGALSRYVNGYPGVDREYLQLRYDIFGSRISLMLEGQPRQHLETARSYDIFRSHAQSYLIVGRTLAELTPGDRQRERILQQTLEPLNVAMRTVANESLIAGRRWKVEQRARYRTYTIETLLHMFGTLVSGFVLTALIIRGRLEVASAREATQREREVTRTYRTLVSIVSHQLRTPLAIIDSSAQRLKRRAVSIDSTEIMRRADYIRQAANGLLLLMDTILDAARLDAGEIRFSPQSTDLGSLIVRLCSQNHDAHDHRVFDVDVAGLHSTVMCDPILIEQALSNIVGNAIKYSDQDAVIHVRAWEEAEKVFVAVKDEGLGIPHDELQLVFMQFFRGRSTQEIPGAGIGLSFARQIAQLHHGDIDVTSQEGYGSTFTLWFPKANAESYATIVRWRT